MQINREDYWTIPMLPLFVCLSYSVVASKHCYWLGNEIVGQLYPFLAENNSLLVQNNGHQQTNLLLLALEKFFSPNNSEEAYTIIVPQFYIEDIRYYVPKAPVIHPYLVNIHRGPPCFA